MVARRFASTLDLDQSPHNRETISRRVLSFVEGLRRTEGSPPSAARGYAGDRIVIPLEYVAMWRVDVEGLRVFAQRYLCPRS